MDSFLCISHKLQSFRNALLTLHYTKSTEPINKTNQKAKQKKQKNKTKAKKKKKKPKKKKKKKKRKRKTEHCATYTVVVLVFLVEMQESLTIAYISASIALWIFNNAGKSCACNDT